MNCRLLIVAFFLLVGGVSVGLGAEDAPRPYELKLFGDYSLFRLRTPEGQQPFRLREGPDGKQRREFIGVHAIVKKLAPYKHIDLIINLSSYATHDERYIVGKTLRGWFIFDTHQPLEPVSSRPTTAGAPTTQPEPTTRSYVFQKLKAITYYPRESLWRDALADEGIPRDIELLEPDAVAATRPNRQIRPWEYRRMGGMFGLPDERLAVYFVLLALGVGFVVGLFLNFQQSPWVLGLMLGLACVVVCWYLMGPIHLWLAIGILATPLLTTLAVYFGAAIHEGLLRLVSSSN
ncbi:MAG: hypothetical protein ACLFVU_03840 [Phycisphaerae bacterium]